MGLMITCVILITLSGCGVVWHLMDIGKETWRSLKDLYRATGLMLYHQFESWRNGFSMVPPFIGLLIQVLRLLAFTAPILLMLEIYVSGVGAELWKTVGVVTCNVSALVVWFLKHRTGWDAFSKVMSLFQNKRLTADWQQLQQHVGGIVSPVQRTQNGTVPVAHATAPAPDIQAQLQALTSALLAQQGVRPM